MLEDKKLELEKVEKIICFPVEDLIMKHVVQLGKKTFIRGKTKRAGDYSTYTFTTKKYNTNTEVLGMSISSSDYIVLEHNSKITKYNAVYISYPHLYKVNKAFNKVLTFFDKKLYPDLFIEQNKKYFIFNINKYKTDDIIYIDIKDLGANTALTIYPFKARNSNNKVKNYIRLVLNNDKNLIIDFTVEEFKNFKTIFSQFDLYQNSLLLQQLSHILYNK